MHICRVSFFFFFSFLCVFSRLWPNKSVDIIFTLQDFKLQVEQLVSLKRHLKRHVTTSGCLFNGVAVRLWYRWLKQKLDCFNNGKENESAIVLLY